MGWGWGWALLWALLGTAPALRCPLCDVTGCRPASCPSPRALCRRTTLTALREGREWRRVESGCDVTGPPDVVITFRSHGELVTLREERWAGGDGPGHAPGTGNAASAGTGSDPRANGSTSAGTGSDPRAKDSTSAGTGSDPGKAPDTPLTTPNGTGRGRPLLCPTCDSADGSCGRPLAALPCPRPADRCIDVISRGPAGVGEGRLRGCGQAGPCRGLVAFESGGGRGVALRCCESRECELEAGPPSGLRCWGCDGPAPSGCAPQALRCGAGRSRCATAWGHGPSGEPWLVRGCATPEWCETPVGLGALWGRSLGPGEAVGREDPVGLSCCRGRFCNALPGDPSPPPSAAPPPHKPLPLLLPLLLLLAAP